MAGAPVASTPGDAIDPIRALFLIDHGPGPARVLWAWCERGHTIAEIWTGGRASRRGAWRRDRRLGWFAPRRSISAAIRRWHIRHRQVETLRAHAELADLIVSLNVDVVISVHFMRILPAGLLSRLSVPVLNLHPSLLPGYRGPNPQLSMIVDEAHARFSGVTLHQIVPALDAGAIFASRSVPLPSDGSLRRWELDLARAAADLAVEVIPEIVAGRTAGVEQVAVAESDRRATLDDLKLTPLQTAKKIEWLCSTIGRVRFLQFALAGRDYAVTGISRHLGPPTGEPPRIGWWTIETDIADARVRLRRTPIWAGRRQRIETWLLRVLLRA
jgi:methionyl-tRNA formyltransferase